MKEIRSLTIIGAGNVGTRLALAFFKAGVSINQICSRTSAHAKRLSTDVLATYVCSIDKIEDSSDFYLFCVPDEKLRSISNEWQHHHKLVAHTAGTTPIEILAPFSDRHGVFYPLQTFSKGHNLSFRNLPICVEANNSDDLQLINNLALKLTTNVKKLSSEQRKVAHLAAVIASNFSNYMYMVAEEILKDQKIDFEIIHPLIMETARKAGRIGPLQAQTGPAIRGDKTTIDAHLKMLDSYPAYKEFYEVITNSILKANKKF